VLDENRLEECAVAVIERALIETQHAFDSVAGDYGRSNSDNPILCAMRSRVLAEVGRRVMRGGRILDLGCGPGVDDESLAREGYRVTAIDWSAHMVEQARTRMATAGLSERVAIQHLGIHQLERLRGEVFDAAFSNFGPLNCVPDLAGAAIEIADHVRRGGVLIASVIGRICPWEIALYTSRGDWSRARIRFTADPVRVPLNGQTVWMRYYAPEQFARAFAAAGFVRVELRGLGVFAPPPYLEGFAKRHPFITGTLTRIDDLVGGWPLFRTWGDHFLIVMKKI
jgi:2-polyprenyl-3-methyl-5-hydroxy-6-metoxy-1,4-benzoquinol methylase